MTMDETVKRINELYHLSKERELSEEEKAEQQALRRKYIDSVTGNLKRELDNTSIVRKDGTKVKLQRKIKH